jgi:hypothetical protein
MNKSSVYETSVVCMWCDTGYLATFAGNGKFCWKRFARRTPASPPKLAESEHLLRRPKLFRHSYRARILSIFA